MAETSKGLEKILNDVQECSLDKNICEEIVKVLDDNNLKPQSIEKLLEICIQDPKDDLNYATETLNVVSVILRKVTAGDFSSKPDLLPSMLQIFRMINTTVYSCSSDELKVLYFKILISYPDEVYQKLKEDKEILELFNLYVHQRIPIDLRVQPINVLHKYLKVLTPEKRLRFVEQGIDVWLLKLVPNVMLLAKTPDFEIETSLTTLEIIVDEFIYIDYNDNPNMQSILQCFEPQKYPAIMQNLLIKGSHIWHRLWIVFIKIFKNQLTKSGSTGSPINSMLPVVETAFKLDVANRCRAFHCWNALIDNFASETNETHIIKRIKLLVIPLYSNNAKVEDTVIAKIQTWWRLICKYHAKLSKFAEMILIPFLQFCFGKPIESTKPVQIPGFLTDKTKEYCVEALVSICGHQDCDGCVSLPVLKDTILKEKFLLASRKDLVHCFEAAISIVANNKNKLRQPYKCAWKSFIKLICNITDDIGRDLFKDLLVMLENVMQKLHDEIVADIVLNDLILTLFEDKDQMTRLLKPKDVQDSLMCRVLFLILNPSFDSSYERNEFTKTVQNFKPLADFIVDHCFHVSFIKDFFNQMPANNNSLVLWSAMTTSICEKKSVTSPDSVHQMLRWSLKYLDLFTKMELATSLWLKLFDWMQYKLEPSSINDEVLEVLNVCENISNTNSSFFLNIAMMLLSKKISTDNGNDYEKEVRLVNNISSTIHGLNHTDPIFLKLIDILLELFKKLLKDVNLDIAKQALMILKVVFTLLIPEFKKSTDVDAVVLIKIEKLLSSVNDFFKIEAYASLKQIVSTEFLAYAEYLGKQATLRANVLALLDVFLKSSDDNQLSDAINNMLATLKADSISTNLSNKSIDKPIDKPKFTTPPAKKAKKKETSIVNTVVENGEEYVVVKCNWKFNPKKLTENQKEKLKRKRDDIPALYQDLSQSQDEFKLSTWKTDSQDTTTTNSKSNDLTTNEKVSSILKNMPNTDVVPKILKNILAQNNEKNSSITESKNESINEIQSPNIKGVKPKLSLKDRVFRNVRNLMEKSGEQNNENQVKLADCTTSGLQTPTGMRIKIPDANSAPSEINIDRPSRVKRKPKKFEEMQIFAVKKRRHSLCTSDSQNKEFLDDSNNCHVVMENPEIDEMKSHSSEIVSGIQENQNILVSNSADVDELKTNYTPSKNVYQEKIAQDKVDDNQQHNNKSDLLPATSHINIENKVAIDNSIVAIIDKNESNGQCDAGENSSIQNSISKKPGKKKSRIEKELAIDMVEGHPFLKVQSEKRLTRKKASESPVVSRRKSSTQKLNKSKIDQNLTPKVDNKNKEIDKVLDESRNFDTVPDSQESKSQDENGSQDIIESSQDSTISIMSVKSSKTVRRIPIMVSENTEHEAFSSKNESNKKSLNTHRKVMNDSIKLSSKSNDDSEFPLNKTAEEHVLIDLTENLDTEPIGNISSNEIIIIKDDKDPPNPLNLEKSYIDIDTQDIADAETQPMNSHTIVPFKSEDVTHVDESISLNANKIQERSIDSTCNIDTSALQTQEENTRSLTESLLCAMETNEKENVSNMSPKDEEQRKQDFLSNTLEISPIKPLSPVRENKSPSPETSSDYVVIKLSSPVQCNGEPFEKCDSPEIFTEEKVSPGKRDQSPPREETRLNTASPRSLSLKKNKPQVRPGGRAAQMLGLCIPGPERLQTILNSEKPVDAEEPKKSSPLNSSARRNLRILYNSTSESNEKSEETDESDNFLKMKRSLPAADSSPSVPILKRKLADIIDDTTVSPANKRKRVSFHDPPVSTTVCVKKYIEASGVRSPQNSSTKRLERQSRAQLSGNLKSQKRLDTVFKLDTALIKAVESFSEADVTPNATEDTEVSSLEPTPQVEVVKNSDLNDVDPICLELINCKDPIDNIAGDLSSSAMRPLLVKEFADKIETVGDLAKMTELEVNRLCIKAPKIQVTKKVLTEYAKKLNTVANEMTPMTEAAFSESTVMESKAVDVEMQTDCVTIENVEMQTDILDTSLASTQTNTVSTVDCDAQTEESGVKSTADIATSLLEKPDYCDHLKEVLDNPSKQSIANSLPLSVLTETVLKQIGVDNTSDIIDRLLEKHADSINGRVDNPRLTFMRNYLSERFSSKDLILLCSDLLKKIYDNSV